MKSTKETAHDRRSGYKGKSGIWKYILKSVTLGLSYEFVEYDDEQGKIPVCRHDFYGTKRKFYAILNSLKLGHKLTDIP